MSDPTKCDCGAVVCLPSQVETRLHEYMLPQDAKKTAIPKLHWHGKGVPAAHRGKLDGLLVLHQRVRSLDENSIGYIGQATAS